MKIDFNGKGKGKHKVSGLISGDYETMVKTREKELPHIQETIQEVLENYSGESICIVIQKEDENGMPEASQIFMAGVSRMECQLTLGKALNDASQQAIEILMESAKGDVKAMMTIAKALTKLIEKED